MKNEGTMSEGVHLEAHSVMKTSGISTVKLNMIDYNIYSHVVLNKMTVTHDNIMYEGAIQQFI
jgi:hypothetical protein